MPCSASCAKASPMYSETLAAEDAPAQSRTAGAPVIVARGLGKRYQMYRRSSDRLWHALLGRQQTAPKEFWALRGLDLEIRRGETVGIVGRNGSGKSTL